jgi:hypothetical protein
MPYICPLVSVFQQQDSTLLLLEGENPINPPE